MVDVRVPDIDLNARLATRSAIFLEPWIQDIVRRIYDCTLVPLDIKHDGEALNGYAIERLWKKQLVLAPYNFQPVLRDLSADITHALINKAGALGARWSSCIRLHHPLDDSIIKTLKLGVSADAVETLVSLEGGFDHAVAAMYSRQRNKMRKVTSSAANAGVVVRRFQDCDTLKAFYRALTLVYGNKHRMLPQPYSLFEALLAAPAGVRTVHAYAACDERTNDLLGGVVILADERQWTYAWGVTDSATVFPNISTLLIGTAMKDAAIAGAKIFNLGASPLSHSHLRQFKRSWGGEEHLIHTYHWREPARERDLHAGYSGAKAVLARCPAWLLESVSPIAVKLLA